MYLQSFSSFKNVILIWLQLQKFATYFSNVLRDWVLYLALLTISSGFLKLFHAILNGRHLKDQLVYTSYFAGAKTWP